MAQYSKLIAVVLGMIVLLIKKYSGIDLGGDFVDKVTELIIMLVTAFSVYRVTNKPAA